MATQNSQDLDLEKYFTDVEELRGWFEQALGADKLPKRLLVIWGVGGIGKSSLLRMFRLQCKRTKIAVGLASGDEAKSAVDVLSRWADDLKADGVNLPTFFKTYEHYRAIQAKVENETSKAQKKLGDLAGKATSKTAEAAGGAALGAALGSVVPGIGTAAGAALGGVIGGMGAEALVDYLRGFLTKPDIDLLLDPTKKLTDDFLADVNQAASKQRIVLMLDTYEQMTALDGWTRDVAQRLNENVLLVIAGRAMVNWGRQWSSWLMHAEVQELKPMPKRVMHELIRKYYATMRGGEPNPKQVNAIIEFSGGLPMVVNTAVQLWVKYGVEDFGAVKGEVVREVVNRLREGVPTELYPLLETAAALRYFNKDILRAVSEMGDISTGYEELLRFPFVRRRAEGYALHDRVRDMIEENVRTDDPAKYRAVHERAAAYFEARMENATSEEADRLGLERLYHEVGADELSGIGLFQETAERLLRWGLYSSLNSLLKEATSYDLNLENSALWIQYYKFRVAQFSVLTSDNEAIEFYERIGRNEKSEAKLKAYALSDLCAILAAPYYLNQASGIERAIGTAKQAIAIAGNIDTKLAGVYLSIGRIYFAQCKWDEGLEYLFLQLKVYRELNDAYGIVNTFGEMKNIHAVIGDWRSAANDKLNGMLLIDQIPETYHLKTKLLGEGVYDLVWSGQYSEAEQALRQKIEYWRVNSIDLRAIPYYLRDLGLVLCLEQKYSESSVVLQEALQFVNTDRTQTSFPGRAGTFLGFWGTLQMYQDNLEQAEITLQDSINVKRANGDSAGLPELYNWLGELNELKAQKVNTLLEATELYLSRNFYQKSLELRWTGRRYFETGAFSGLARVSLLLKDYAAIPPLLTEAEQLAQQYEYNDHLASLRLTQGHIAWEGKTFEVSENLKGLSAFDAAFDFYKLALVYALRYNRFLLDEVLAGRPQGTPLRPIIPECLKHGEQGLKMLRALREWWQTGKNDVGAPRPDTISPIPEGIALLEAEKIAREREPGDNSPQTSVIKRLNQALKEAKHD